MRVSIPGFPGLYYDTDADSAIATTAFTALGRRAPKPQGYAVQLLPYLWSFEVDLREVPPEHPIQYLHPEGARSLGTLSRDPNARAIGTDLEGVLRFVWAVNRETEDAVRGIVGGGREAEGVVIEIEDGSVAVDGAELETDEFDVDEPTDPDPDAFETEPADSNAFEDEGAVDEADRPFEGGDEAFESGDGERIEFDRDNEDESRTGEGGANEGGTDENETDGNGTHGGGN